MQCVWAVCLSVSDNENNDMFLHCEFLFKLFSSPSQTSIPPFYSYNCIVRITTYNISRFWKDINAVSIISRPKHRPTSSIPDMSNENKHEQKSDEANEIDEANDRAIADVLLAADLEDVGEDAFEEMCDEDNKGYTDVNDETNRNLVSKHKRKMELKAGLLKEILFNKPKRHTFSGLYI